MKTVQSGWAEKRWERTAGVMPQSEVPRRRWVWHARGSVAERIAGTADWQVVSPGDDEDLLLFLDAL